MGNKLPASYLIFVIGYVLGGLHWGLVCHFWAGMPRPKTSSN